jgi:hypothetical protein
MADKSKEDIAAEKAKNDADNAAAEAKAKSDADAKSKADALELEQLRAYRAQREAADAAAPNMVVTQPAVAADPAKLDAADDELIRQAVDKKKHVKLHKGGETIAVHPDTVRAHTAKGWLVA